MNSELIVKDVEFHGDMLRAAQDPDGKVWVGVRWMCQGIGFGEDKIDNERKKIQKDVVISQGVKFHSLGSGNSNTKVLCLDLDYVPLWLAKIAITPTMQRENPVLVNKLIDYQLKAKDVLAAAFLGDKKTTEEIVPVYKPQGNMIQLQFPDIQMPTIPDYSNRLDEINNKIDKLYTEIGKFATAMMNKNADPVKLNNAIPVKKEDKKKVVSPTEQEYYDWKKRTNEFVDKLSESSKFTDRNSVLKYLYDYINKTYGIVWDQEKREYRRRHSNISKVSTFDVIYEDEQLRSIFDCTLADMAEKYKNTCKIDLIMQPLIKKINDESANYTISYRKVYAMLRKTDPKITYMRPDTVWAMVEYCIDHDYCEEAEANGISESGKFNYIKADLDYIPKHGFYRYKTSPVMTGEWIIAGEMKVIKILSDQEVKEICDSCGSDYLPRKETINLSEFGFAA